MTTRLEEINVFVLMKRKERYVWLYSDSRIDDVLKSFGRFAANKDLSFTWYDAAASSQRLRSKKT